MTGLKAKLILVLFGLTVGGGAAMIARPMVMALLNRSPAGTTFDDLSDLRRNMIVEGEEKDSQGSVTLRSIISAHPNDSIIFDLRPNLNVRFQRAPVSTNSCGMRGPERPVKKPHNTFRIALLGDSFTFGWGVDQKKIFPQRIEDTLNRASNGAPHFEVLNFGVPGYSTFQEVAKFEESGLDFEPDAVVVFFVENDFGLPFFIRDAESSSGGLLSSISLSRSKTKEKRALPTADPNQALQQLARICEEHGIPLYVAFNPKKRWVRDRKKLWVIDERSDIQVMRLREEFMASVNTRGIKAEDLSLTFDPHPSELKHELLGDLIAQYFLSEIQ